MGNAIKKVSEWHKSIVDWELANPHKSMGDCARFFRVTESWLSSIRNADAYMEYRYARRQMHNEKVSTSVIEQVEGIAKLSLEVMKDRIEAEREKIGIGLVKDTAEMALKAMGFGSRYELRNAQAGPTTINNTINVAVANSGQLASARKALAAANQTVTPIIEGGIIEPAQLMPATEAISSSGAN